MMRIFGPESKEITGVRRILYNEQGHDFIFHRLLLTCLIKRRMKGEGYVSRRGEMRSAYSILVVKPEWKIPRQR
jgi:hypothetical protein